jgi:hypothetical protein
MSTKVYWTIRWKNLLLSPQIAGIREVFQLHDNARLCTALSIKQFLSVHQITVLLHAPYSPDLSPYNFFLFPWLKRVLKGHQYNDNQAIQSWQNSCVAFQQVLARTTSKTSTNAGSGILMKEEAFQRKSLAPECKNTIHIFKPSVLELYTHRLYFKIMQEMQVIWCCIRSSWSNNKGINYHLTQLMYIIYIIMATCFWTNMFIFKPIT